MDTKQQARAEVWQNKCVWTEFGRPQIRSWGYNSLDEALRDISRISEESRGQIQVVKTALKAISSFVADRK